MNSASQSRHFNLHWLERPQAWLTHLDHLWPQDPKDAWSWHVTHHHLLTLAKRSEREAGLSILWFSVSSPQEDPEKKSVPLLLGAVLPSDRIAIVAPAASAKHPLTSEDATAIANFLKTRIKIASVMGSETSLRTFGFLDNIFERQVAWGKRLATVSPSLDVPSDTALGRPLVSRRAIETDRPLLGRWARIFAAETRANVNATVLETAEWMRRGRLFIFETNEPVGMTALSGEFEDRTFGRSCRLSLIFTEPSRRGRGIGHDMLKAIEHEVRLENANALILYSDAANPRIQNFYSGLGFKPCDDWVEASLSAR